MPSGGMGMMRGGAGGNAGPGMNRGGVGGYDSSVLTSECETNSMLDTTDDDATTRSVTAYLGLYFRSNTLCQVTSWQISISILADN